MFQIEMMKTILLAIMFLSQLSLAQVEGHKCGGVGTPLIPDISLLETGIKIIEKTDTTERIETFTINFQYDPPSWGYDVAATLLYIEDYLDSNQIDFSVRTAHKDEKAFLLIFVMSESAHWAKAHPHYFVTSREDIRAGELVVSNLDVLLAPAASGQFEVIHEISERPWQESNQVEIFAYVSGVKTKDKFFTLKQIKDQNNLVGTTLKLIYEITEKEHSVENLHISYFILNEQSPVNTVAITDIGEYTIGTMESREAFAGITDIRASEVEVYFSQVLVKLGLVAQGEQAKTVKVIDNLVDVFQKGYFASGINLKQFSELPLRLGFVPEEEQSKEEETKCLFSSQCSENSGQILVTNGSKNCLICDKNKQYNSKTQECECMEDFIEGQNGNCLSGEEVCGKDAFLFEKKCVQVVSSVLCQENYYYSVEEKSCKCKTERPDNGQCPQQCIKPLIYSPIFSKCVSPPPQIIDEENCDDARQWNSQTQKCQCAAPFYPKSDGECLFCPGNTEFNKEQQKCVCLPGYIQRGSICRRARIRG